MTAAAMKGDRERCLAAGMDAYISKPINAEELFHAITEQTDSLATTDSKAVVTEKGDNIATHERQVVDFAAALDNISGGKQVLQDLAKIFLEECPKLIKNIEQSLDYSDAQSVQRAAHTLKSSALIMVANELVAMTAHIEKLAANKNLSDIKDCIDSLRIAADEANVAIGLWLEQESQMPFKA